MSTLKRGLPLFYTEKSIFPLQIFEVSAIKAHLVRPDLRLPRFVGGGHFFDHSGIFFG